MAEAVKLGNKLFKLPRVKRRRRVQDVKCIAYPNRTRRRVFTPKKIGDIVCRLLGEVGEQGEIGSDPAALRAELRRELDRCFPCGDGDQRQRSALQEAVAAARQALSENATVIAVALSVMLALLVLPRLFAAFPGVILALVPLAARTAINQVPGIVTRLQAQQAANAAMFRRVSGL